MVSIARDFTSEFNSTLFASGGSTLNLDTSAFDYVIVQIIGINGAVTFNATMDDGSTLSSQGNNTTATNWFSIQGTNMNNGATVNNTSASGLYKFTVPGKFLQLTGTAVTITKLIIYFAKISL